ncbi:hypothetical protein Avbf_08444 [Armadillidium vulgare]|nr:hypothetical protein Avbf_08444 [Armadillidium vulgare]
MIILQIQYKLFPEPRGEGGLRLLTAWDHEISLERTSYRVLETKSPTSAQMFPILSRQQTHIGKELVNRYDWTFSPAEHVYRHDGMKVSFMNVKVTTAECLFEY